MYGSELGVGDNVKGDCAIGGVEGRGNRRGGGITGRQQTVLQAQGLANRPG